MFCAYYLLKSGHSVILIDKDPIGNEASVYNAGLLTPSLDPARTVGVGDVLVTYVGRRGSFYISPLEILTNLGWYRHALRGGPPSFENIATEIGAASLKLYREFFYAEGIEPDVIPGVVALYERFGEAERASRVMNGELLDESAVSRMGYTGVRGGVALRDELSINPRKLFTELRTRLTELGANTVLGKSATLSVTNKEVRVTSDGEVVEPGTVIMAAGAWCKELCKPLGYNPAVLPARGLAMIFDTKGREIVRAPGLLEDAGITISQHSNSVLRVTSLFEMVGMKRNIGEGQRKWLRNSLERHVPAFMNLKCVEQGVGYRPCSPDQLPIIGRVPGYEDVYIATGNCRLGMTRAPITAQILKSIIEKDDSFNSVKGFFSPQRFG